MRARVIAVGALLLTFFFAGCMGGGAPTPSGPPSSSDPSTSSSPVNQAPLAVIEVFNATQSQTLRHFLGENVTLSGAKSSDAEGRIASFTWRIIEDGVYATHYGELEGPQVKIRFQTPGDRVVALFVEDEGGLVGYGSVYVSVHQRIRGAGELLPGPVAVAGVTSHEYVLPVKAGAILFSIEANFTPMDLTKVRLEIKLPNGMAINRTEVARSPAWSVAMAPATVGNYTAVIHLLQGAPLPYRLEFVAWYGYGL